MGLFTKPVAVKTFIRVPVAPMPKMKELVLPTATDIFMQQVTQYCSVRYNTCVNVEFTCDSPANTQRQEIYVTCNGVREKKTLLSQRIKGLMYKLCFLEDIKAKETPQPKVPTDVVTAESWMADNYDYIISQKQAAGDEIFTIPFDMLPDDEDVVMQISEAIMNSGYFAGTIITDEGLSVLPLAA